MKRVKIGVLVVAFVLGVTASVQADLDICRSAGFWSTHAGEEKNDSQNITQAVLDAGGPLQICGTEISNTLVGDWGSALEAMCVSPQGDSSLQLIRQLTATGLNCIFSDIGADCGAGDTAELFELCDGACRDGSDPFLIDGCILELECLNEGGTMASYSKIGPCRNLYPVGCT